MSIHATEIHYENARPVHAISAAIADLIRDGVLTDQDAWDIFPEFEVGQVQDLRTPSRTVETEIQVP